jgi:hypothetical protein
MRDAPVLILPGLYNSGPDHWQSRWEAHQPELRRVLQEEWERPICGDWVMRLDAAVLETPGAVLVAHSASCALVAHWVDSRPAGRVRAALLVAPTDPEAPSFPVEPSGFATMPMLRLPFRSVVIASTNDPYITLERAQEFAEAWGSRFISIGTAGHINGQSGLGDWPVGFAILQELRPFSCGPVSDIIGEQWARHGKIRITGIIAVAACS